MIKILLLLVTLQCVFVLSLCDCSDQSILKAARTYLNNDRWKTETELTSFDGKVKFKSGEFKHELFLYDMLTMAGCRVPLHKKKEDDGSKRKLPPTANQWAYRRIKGFSHKWRHFTPGNIIVNPGIPKVLPNGQVGIFSKDSMAITVGDDGIVRESESMFSDRPVRLYLEADQ